MKQSYYKISPYIICAAIVFALIMSSTDLVRAETMSSGSYKIQSDSMNFEGSRSTSASYAAEDTSGEIGTGYSQSASTNLHAGFQQRTIIPSTTTTTPATSTTNVTTSTNGGGFAYVLNVLNFAATPQSQSIILSWEYPSVHNIYSVTIVRSETFFPIGIDDGSIIFEGNISGNIKDLIDHDVIAGKYYYYTIFSRDFVGRYSSGVVAAAQVPILGMPIATSTDVFGDIPMAPISEVHPMIYMLTLADFDFIQDGVLINHAGKIIVIDGKKNLTVRLAYNKVPQILKTIAMTLTDPDDSSRVFTFLLRANLDETAYEATIAPLGRSGQYKLNAIVLDYKNQGLKKMEGMLRALAFDANARSLVSDSSLLYAILIILILIIIIPLIYRRKENRRRSSEKTTSQS